MSTYLLCLKLQNLQCTHIVAYNFGMCTSDDSEDMQYTWDTQHTKDPCTSQAYAWFATLLVWCTGTIAIDNEMHLFYSLSVCCNNIFYEIYGCVLIDNQVTRDPTSWMPFMNAGLEIQTIRCLTCTEC